MTARRRVAAFLVLLLLFGLAAPAGAAPGFEISVRGNRADLVSGGDALVEVVLPTGVAPATVRVSVNGTDATAAFAVRENGRFMGVVEGLADGGNDVQVFVDPASMPHIEGAHVDYVDTMMGAGFKVENPNAVSTCGCGHSFRT